MWPDTELGPGVCRDRLANTRDRRGETMSNSNRDTLRDIIVERLSATEAREEPDVFESVLEIYSRVDTHCSVRDFDGALDSLVIDGLVSRPPSRWEGIDLLRLQPKRGRAVTSQRLLGGWARACQHKCKNDKAKS